MTLYLMISAALANGAIRASSDQPSAGGIVWELIAALIAVLCAAHHSLAMGLAPEKFT